MTFTVAQSLTDVPLALSQEAAGPLLAQGIPEASMSLEPGERYGVKDGVAVLPLRGILTANSMNFERWFGWSTYHGLEAAAGELQASADVEAVAIVSDSPGGMVLGVDAAAEAVSRLAAQKPVHVLVHPLAASGAYWISSQATEICVTPGSWVGSIGVIQTTAAPVAPGSSGDQRFVATSRHAKAKWPNPATESGAAELQRQLDVIEAAFHRAVAKGRGIDVEELLVRGSHTAATTNGGGVFWGQGAIDAGLADRMETSAEFWARLASVYRPDRRPARGRAARAHATFAQAVSKI